jgi:type I restriction enzyme, S subunit
MVWTEATLGEICDQVGGIIQTGPFGSQLHQSDYSEEGIPVVMPKDIIEGRIVTDSIACVTSKHVERLSKDKLEPGDIVYGRRGDIGRQALIRQQQAGWLCGTGCLRLSLGDTVIDPSFLHYYLREPDVIGWIANQAIGATLPNLNTSILRSVPIHFPSLPTQRKIAAILSAYDDLIENNLRRIKILEEMAQNLYREWFVKFRFPGHQTARFTDSSLGQIPEGWAAVPLGQLANQIRDGVNPNSVDPGTPYFGLEHLPKQSITLSKWGIASEVKSTKLLFKTGDILFGKIRPYFHKVGVAPLSGVCSSDTIVIRPRSSDLFGIVLGCTSSVEFIKHATVTSQGTKMPRANWDVLVNYEIPMPLQPILGEFNEFMCSVVNQLQNFIFRNQSLRRTRDLLLPKLISGEVDVSELDINIPEEAEA